MRKKRRSYSILFVPEGDGKTLSFNVGPLLLRALIAFVVIFFITAIVAIISAGHIAIKLQKTNSLILQNKQLLAEKKSMAELEKKLIDIKIKEEKIKILASGVFNRSSYLAGINNTKNYLSEKEIDAFILAVRKKQKALELYPSLRGKYNKDQFLYSIPTLRPVNGWITNGFFNNYLTGNSSTRHNGIDFAVAIGTPVFASAKGIITYNGWDKLLGKIVIINHGLGYETRYAHCSRIFVKKGDFVKKGQTIALTGNTGLSTAPHLHYEIRKNGVPVDPLLYFVY